MQQEIFRQIVTLDESRVLIRLRSSHAPRSKKARGRVKPKLMASLNGAVLDKSGGCDCDAEDLRGLQTSFTKSR